MRSFEFSRSDFGVRYDVKKWDWNVLSTCEQKIFECCAKVWDYNYGWFLFFLKSRSG